MLYIVGRRLRLEFQHTDGAENTDIGGVFETAERFQVLLQALFNPSDTRCIIATFEQRKRCNSRGACQRVCHVSGSVHKCRNLAVRNCFGNLLGCDTSRHCNASARKCLADAHDVGLNEIGAFTFAIKACTFSTRGMHHCESRASAVESRSDFVQNQQDTVTVAKLTERFQITRIIEPHAVPALENRFADDGGDFVFMLAYDPFHRSKIAIVPRLVEPAIRAFRKVVLRHNPAEKYVHPVGVGERHGTRGIAVVAALQGDQLTAFRAGERMLVLHCHLGGAFHGNASRIREENLVESLWQEIYKAFTQFNRRLVRKSAEHYVAHFFALLANCLDYLGSVMTVGHAPPT